MFQFQSNLLILILTQVHSISCLDTIYNQVFLRCDIVQFRLGRNFLNNRYIYHSIHIYLSDILYIVLVKYCFRSRLWNLRDTYHILYRNLMNYNDRLDNRSMTPAYLCFGNIHLDRFYTLPTLLYHYISLRHNFCRNFDLFDLDKFFRYMHCILHHLLTTNLSDMFHKADHIHQERIHNHFLCKKHNTMRQGLLLSRLVDILYMTFGDYCLQNILSDMCCIHTIPRIHPDHNPRMHRLIV